MSLFFKSLLSEIETMLMQLDKIKDCGTIGYSDDLAGELALAFIVKSDPQLTAGEVRKFMSDRVTNEKRLHGGLVFVDEIPRSPSGKVMKCELNKMLKHFALQSKL